MRIIRSVSEMQAEALRLRREGKRPALVPTMGYLHEGHLSLVRRARTLGDVLVVSLFVNPTQFGPGEDLDRYPHDFARDRALCEEAGVDILFCPEADDVYAPDATVHVAEDKLSQVLCGASRPTHFGGVLTVVAKLFNIVLPHVAVFGQKDAQQLCLIRRMVRELNVPVEIVAGPIVREPDGLAMSSRNQYLSDEERVEATCLNRALRQVETLFLEGTREADALRHVLREVIAGAPAGRLDYAEIVDLDTLDPVEGRIHRPALAAVAVRFGQARLIDNVVLDSGACCGPGQLQGKST